MILHGLRNLCGALPPIRQFRAYILALALMVAFACAPQHEPADQEVTKPAKIPVEELQDEVANAPDLDAVVEILSQDDDELRQRLKEHQRKIETTDVVPEENERGYLMWRADIEGRAIQEFDTAQGHFDAGRALEGEGYAAEAREQYEAARQKDPSMAEAHAAVGRTAFKSSENEAAIEAYQRALELAPDRPGWICELGECYYAMENDEDAAAQFEKALELKPDFGKAHMRLGTVYWRFEEFEKAHNHLTRARELGEEPNIQLLNLVRDKLGMPPLPAPEPPEGTHDLVPSGANLEPPQSIRRPGNEPEAEKGPSPN